MTKHRWFIVLSSISVLCILLVLSGASSVSSSILDDKGKAQGLDEKIAELENKYAKLEKRSVELKQQVSRLSRTSAPVGTVVAFAGEWPPKKGEGGKWTEEELGWMLCDGRDLKGDQYAELREVLGKEVLPDYCGYFLRGLDRDIEGKSAGRDPTRTLGSVQKDTTRLPRKPFMTGTGKPDDHDGEHSHAATKEAWGAGANKKKATFDHLVMNGVGFGPCTTNGKNEDAGGAGEEPNLHDSARMEPGRHFHTVGRGGDAETRPINVSVFWIIRTKSD